MQHELTQLVTKFISDIEKKTQVNIQSRINTDTSSMIDFSAKDHEWRLCANKRALMLMKMPNGDDKTRVWPLASDYGLMLDPIYYAQFRSDIYQAMKL